VEFARPNAPRRPRESVIPLINVVFLLLIFFLLAGSLEAPDLWPVEPPAAAEALPAAREQALLLLTADGRVAFREQPVAGDELARAVAAYLRDGGDPVVQVKADGRARAGELLTVLEALREAGVAELDLLAELLP
jgi:biopolymer transport protein ExbD